MKQPKINPELNAWMDEFLLKIKAEEARTGREITEEERLAIGNELLHE